MQIADMKLLRLTMFFLLVLGIGFTANAQKVLPSITVNHLDGKATDLQSLVKEDAPILISVWATWCKPCHKELDTFADYYEEWKEEYGLTILAVTIDTQRALSKVKPMVESNGWEFEIFSDTKQALQTALNFRAIPQTFLVDGKGEIVYNHAGYYPGVEYEIEDILKKIK